MLIHIFGASGSGTTTLGREICRQNGFTHLDTDDYFWLPTDPKYACKRPKEERLFLLKRDVQAAQNAVLTGSLCAWGDALIPAFQLAVRLETDTDTRIARLRAREKAAFGSRIQPGGDMHETHEAFIAWAMRYDDGGLDMRSRAMHDAWQKQLRCPLLCLNGGDVLQHNVQIVLQALQQIKI